MPGPKRILILGGTTEARALAARLLALGHAVTTSLAGVTSQPILPVGKLRKGGFGGADGLADHIAVSQTEVLIDATHPFAAQMSAHAVEAAKRVGLQFMRLERPEWKPQLGADWVVVNSMVEAAASLPQQARVLVTTGRKQLEALFKRNDLSGVIRVVEALHYDIPAQWQQILDRPPYEVDQERTLLANHRMTHLICKNAGGASTAAKLEAARLLNVGVIMLRRPTKPPCATFATVDDLVAQLGSAGHAG